MPLSSQAGCSCPRGSPGWWVEQGGAPEASPRLTALTAFPASSCPCLGPALGRGDRWLFQLSRLGNETCPGSLNPGMTETQSHLLTPALLQALWCSPPPLLNCSDCTWEGLEGSSQRKDSFFFLKKCIFIYLFRLRHVACGILVPPIRDRTRVPCSGSVES